MLSQNSSEKAIIDTESQICWLLLRNISIKYIASKIFGHGFLFLGFKKIQLTTSLKIQLYFPNVTTLALKTLTSEGFSENWGDFS